MTENEPFWLERDAIISIHEVLLARFGGASGIRDETALMGALGRPKNLYYYQRPSYAEMAAAYSYGLVLNHAFVDGNKRIGFMAAYIFLGINGYALKAPEEEAVLHTVALAAGQMPESEFAAWLAASCVAV